MNNGITILGKTGLKEIGRKRHFDPSRGPVDTIIYEGTHEDVQAAEASIAGANLIYECDYTLGTPKARFTITTPDFIDAGSNGAIQNTYEIQPNMASMDGWEHNKSLALSESDRNLIKEYAGKKPMPKPSSVQNSLSTLNARTFYQHLYRGQTGFYHGGFEFRVNAIIHYAREIPISFSNTGKNYTHAQLIAEGNPPANFIPALNSAYNSTLSYGEGVFMAQAKNAPRRNYPIQRPRENGRRLGVGMGPRRGISSFVLISFYIGGGAKSAFRGCLPERVYQDDGVQTPRSPTGVNEKAPRTDDSPHDPHSAGNCSRKVLSGQDRRGFSHRITNAAPIVHRSGALSGRELSFALFTFWSLFLLVAALLSWLN